MAEARRMQQHYYAASVEALTPFDDKAEPLRQIARVIVERQN
jgi:hypothetical protein